MNYKKLVIVALSILLVAQFAGASAFASQSLQTNPQNQTASATAIPDWSQANSNGFGDPDAVEVSMLQAFNGYLYAGTYNAIDGARIFRSPDGSTWTPVTEPGFGIAHDIAPLAILDAVVFNTKLYASTGLSQNAGQIWRTNNGLIWAPMTITGFSDPDNVDITALAAYSGKIYAGVTNRVTGAQIWNSFTGDNNSWTQVAPQAPGTDASDITGFAEFDGGLYAAVHSQAPAQIWVSYGADWTVAVSDGFGDSNTKSTGGLAVFGNYLYVAAGNTTTGAQLWRTSDGTTWEQVISPAGLGDQNNQKIESVFVFQNKLYLSMYNTHTGLEVWRSANGTIWERANLDGFGDVNNTGTRWSNASENFLSQLYLGTSNVVAGGELWRMVSTAPTDILLTNNTVDENQPVNTVVGQLSAISPDPAATFTFSLACAIPGADDISFNVLTTSLRTSAAFNFEAKSTYNICLRVTDQGGLTFDKNFVVNVVNVNEAPTNISLSNDSVNENQPVNTVVGVLSATDPDAGATFTFSLACEVAGPDDGSFNILGTNLRTSAIFDFETKFTYNVCIRVTDQGGVTFDKNFLVNVNNVSEVQVFIYLPVVVR